MSSIWNRFKHFIIELFQSRTSVSIIAFCLLFSLLVSRIFNLQIINGESYVDQYELQIQKTKEIEGTRGNIYDRNGKLLAYNELAYSVTIEDNGSYDTRAEKNEILNDVINTVISIVESNGDSVINDFGIILNSNNEYVFTAESDTKRLRFIADVYGELSASDLSDEQQNQTATDIMTYLCTDETYGYGIDQDKMSKQKVLQLVNIRYNMSLNSYQKYIATTIAQEVSDETVAAIMENADTLQGVSISEESIRKYTDDKYFANVIGYTGKISQEEYDELDESVKDEYDLNDTVGKAGIEKTMDTVLKGTKGEEKIYVNSVGKVIDEVSSSEAGAGNDLYLTIDSDLQKAAYDIIEQELAGILMAKLVNVLDYDRTTVSDGSDVVIPIGDVYNSFIANGIIDINHLSDEDAMTAEKEVYETYSSYKEKMIKNIEELLNDQSGLTYKESSKEMQAYQSYIVTDLLTTTLGVIDSSAIDTNDSIYIAWKDTEKININKFLTYAISKNWIDTSKIGSKKNENAIYTNATETYDDLVSYIIDYIRDDSNFNKLLFKYMIKSGTVTGRQICMMLYEQGFLKWSDSQYNALSSGGRTAYDFIRGKIETLEITPGQIGLEPCTGSCVITDPNSGEVLACVSYPGYDNNQLANSMDSTYFSELVNNSASPLFNNATQEKTAPGSTYKPLVAVAGLTEGVITTDTLLVCRGLYERVEPNPKCWAYPSAHGALNVEGAIENSCNCYFFEVGFKLSLTNYGVEDTATTTSSKYYSSDLGLSNLAKYATEFGLNTTSGVEIPEAEPKISDDSSVPSAIGQGTNNYTTTQLARYCSAIANKGTVYSLSLLDKVTSPDGTLIEDYTPEVTNTLDEVTDETWEAVHNGMRNVVLKSHRETFSAMSRKGIELSGKTGTAQQSKTHPDHALFIGFAPSSDPEIAFAVRIANGYSSTYAAEVSRDLMEYYFEVVPEDEIITGTANTLGTGSSND